MRLQIRHISCRGGVSTLMLIHDLHSILPLRNSNLLISKAARLLRPALNTYEV